MKMGVLGFLHRVRFSLKLYLHVTSPSDFVWAGFRFGGGRC